MRSQGITLIETMVAVAILGILIAAGMPSLGDYVANSRLRGVAEQMREGLALARMEGIQRNTTINFVPNNTGWSVVLPGAGLNPAVTIARRDALATETAVSVAPSVALAAFNGSGRLTNAASFSLTVTQVGGTCIANGGPVRCLNVNAVAGGAIRVCDPAQPSSKPEGC